MNHDPKNDFLGFSLADAVITKLGYVSTLAIRPSSTIQKYRDQTIDVTRVAAELNVDTLLASTFIREGEDLRVTSQLIDVKTQDILWRDAFDLKYDKLRSVQDTVAQEIIKGLELKLTESEAEQMTPDAAVNPVAYEYYLRGVDLYSRGDFLPAIKMLEASTQIDPNYALPGPISAGLTMRMLRSNWAGEIVMSRHRPPSKEHSRFSQGKSKPRFIWPIC